MKKFFLFTLAIFIVLCAPLYAQQECDIEKATQSVAKVVARDGTGTGVFVELKDGSVALLTARHVAQDAPITHVEYKGYTYPVAETVYDREGLDVAIVRLYEEPHDLVTISIAREVSRHLRPDMIVRTIGYPLDGPLTVRTGRTVTQEDSLIEATASVNSGDSGGLLAICNPAVRSYQFLGLIQAFGAQEIDGKYVRIENTSFSVPAHLIERDVEYLLQVLSVATH